MSISTDIEVKNIKEYARLLKERYLLMEELSSLNDRLVNLSVFMSNDDINRANELFEDYLTEE